MSGPIFEHYKAALRRGHLATLAGDLDEALDAYREAARIVPDRTVPLASQGTVLHRLNRWPEAAAAFDHALRLAPDDEPTLRARGTALEERGKRSSAAGDFERLAFVLDVAGHATEAVDAARRAGELEASPSRTALLDRLTRSVERATANGVAAQSPLSEARDLDATVDAAAAAEAEATTALAANGAVWPPIDLPTVHEPPTAGPPQDIETVMTNATNLLDAGDTSAARDLMLRAVFLNREAGRLDAALDTCFQLLSFVPGDPQVHLAIANLQLDRGWTPLATEKIELLRQLTRLMGDTQAEADVRGLAAERLRDEPESVSASR